MKLCKERCSVAPLPLSAFYEHPGMSDGRMARCKECHKAYVRANRKRRVEYYRKFDRDRYESDPSRRAAIEARQSRMKRETPGLFKAERQQIQVRFREKNPRKYRAHTALNNAIRDGKISRQPCGTCGSPKAQAHHDDYSRPLDVHWLCSSCHSAHHKALRNSGVCQE